MSYLASPPESPIDLDADVQYKYVIAQQGATSITVDSDDDFEFSVTFGEPALLLLKYVGSTAPTPVYKTVSVRLIQGGLSVLHAISFRILATSGTRRVPNISTGKSIAAAPGQSVNITIGTDIAVDSFNATSLPAGFSVNTSTGHITGSAPNDGFYVIMLRANFGTYHYLRYFVLVVGTGGTGGGGATIGFIGVPDTSRCLFDGDFTTAQISGPPEFEIPFASDPLPYLYKIRYWQFLDNYTELPFGSPGPLGGYYVGGSAGTFKSIGGGVIEFERQFALVPNTRNEYESFVYNQSVYFPVVGRSGTAQISLTVQSRIQYDYFQTDDADTIDLPKAPIMWAPGAVFFLNGFFDIAGAPTGTQVLAQDASCKCWKGNIYERQQRFIPWTNPADVIEA